VGTFRDPRTCAGSVDEETLVEPIQIDSRSEGIP